MHKNCQNGIKSLANISKKKVSFKLLFIKYRKYQMIKMYHYIKLFNFFCLNLMLPNKISIKTVLNILIINSDKMFTNCLHKLYKIN